jgi:hypothetical protein
MSFYGSRRERWLDSDTHWERLMRNGVAAPRQPQPVHDTMPRPAPDFANLRKAHPANHLLPASLRWLTSIPDEVRPKALMTGHARIVNLLALHWNDHDACAAYFADLAVDRRGNREGFPAAVQADLRTLQHYFLHSKPFVAHRSAIRR